MPNLTTTTQAQPPQRTADNSGFLLKIQKSKITKNARQITTESVLFNVKAAKQYTPARLESMIKQHLSGAALQTINLAQISSLKQDEVQFTLKHDPDYTAELHNKTLSKIQSEVSKTAFRNYADISRIISGIHHNTSNTFYAPELRQMEAWMLSLFIDHLEGQAPGAVSGEYIQSLKNSLLLAEFREQGDTLNQQKLFDSLQSNNPNSLLLNISISSEHHHAWGQLYQKKDDVLHCLTVNKGFSPIAIRDHYYTEQAIDKVVQAERLSDFYISETEGEIEKTTYTAFNYGGKAQVIGNCAYIATPNVLGASLARASGQTIKDPTSYKVAKKFQSQKSSDLIIDLMIKDASKKNAIIPAEENALREQLANQSTNKQKTKHAGDGIFDKPFPCLPGGVNVKTLKNYKKDIVELVTGSPLSQASNIKTCCEKILEHQSILPHNKRDYFSLLSENIKKHSNISGADKVRMLTEILAAAEKDEDFVKTNFTTHALSYMTLVIADENFSGQQAMLTLNNADIMHHILTTIDRNHLEPHSVSVIHPTELLTILIEKTAYHPKLTGKPKLFETLIRGLLNGSPRQQDELLLLLKAMTNRTKLASYIKQKTKIPEVLTYLKTDAQKSERLQSAEDLLAKLKRNKMPYSVAKKLFG